MNPQTVLSSPAEDLQRGYAAHTASLRGFLTDGTRARPPKGDAFRLATYDWQEGASVEVEGEFPSAPLFAYLDAIPLRILTDRNPSTGGVQLSLVAPNQSAFGPVRMVWAEKQIVGDVAVNVRRRSVIEIVAVPPDELKSGAYLRFAFLQEPLEVHLAGKEIPRTHFKWEGGYLIVQIPKGAASGQLLVVTRTQVFQSSAPVQIKNP